MFVRDSSRMRTNAFRIDSALSDSTIRLPVAPPAMPGRDHRLAEPLDRPGDVDALAARHRLLVDRPMSATGREVGYLERLVERRLSVTVMIILPPRGPVPSRAGAACKRTARSTNTTKATTSSTRPGASVLEIPAEHRARRRGGQRLRQQQRDARGGGAADQRRSRGRRPRALAAARSARRGSDSRTRTLSARVHDVREGAAGEHRRVHVRLALTCSTASSCPATTGFTERNSANP